MRRFILLGLSLAALFIGVAGCSHFKRGSEAGLRIGGPFKTPSDYAATSLSPKFDRQTQSYTHHGDFKLVWPVTTVRVNRGFMEGKQRRPHQGVDLGGTMGAPILAAHEGVVIYAGRDFRGFGNMILIEYDNNWASLYGHLSRIDVKAGRIVLPGDIIGRMGRTGRASGVHLHFELIHKRQPVDPLRFLAPVEHVAER